MKFFVIIIMLSIVHTAQAAKVKVTKKSCAKVSTKIETINKKMRSKYSIKQGESYRKKLRKLYKKEGQCHKRRFKTK